MNVYYRDLAFHLRMRNYSEDEVTAIVQRAERAVRASGQRPEDLLGSPQEYVATFPERERSEDMRAYHAAFALVGIVGGGYLVLRLFVPAIDVGHRIGLWGVVVCWVLLLVTGPIWAHRKPSARPGADR